MTLRSYIMSLRMCTIFVLCAWVAVIIFISPQEAGVFAYGLFYTTFFLFASGCSILILTTIWRFSAHEVITPPELAIALRQGMLIGLLMVSILILQQFRVLAWWDALLVTAAILLVELYFVTREKV